MKMTDVTEPEDIGAAIVVLFAILQSVSVPILGLIAIWTKSWQLGATGAMLLLTAVITWVIAGMMAP